LAIDFQDASSLTQQEANKMSYPKMFLPDRFLRILSAMAVMMFFSVPVAAQEDLEKPPEIPPIDAPEQPLPPKVQEEQVEPTVTIHEEEERRVEEYSLNGKVYMVKIIPKVGLPYYYIDSDGDGNLETTPAKGLEPVRPVYWKVKEWE
jgi:hypothetical protein